MLRKLIVCAESDGIIDCMCVSVVKGGPVAGCKDGEEGMAGGRLGDTRELVVGTAGVSTVGPVCVAADDDCGTTGDDVTGKFLGSTEGSWMKVVESTIGVGAVV